MKIAVWHNLPSGGGKRALYGHLRGLRRRGHTLEIWCPSSADEAFLPLAEFGAVHALPLAPVPPANPRLGIRGAAARGRRTRQLLAAHHAHAVAVASQIETAGVDAIFANSCSDFGSSYLGEATARRALLYLQEPTRSLYEALGRNPWAAIPPHAQFPSTVRYLQRRMADSIATASRRLQVREERRMAQGYQRILVNSSFSRENVLRAYGLDARVCYLGVDAELFAPTAAAREHLVVSVGALHHGKGADRIVQALGTIPAARRPPLLWIANMVDESYAAKIRERAAREGVAFTVKSSIRDAELVDWLCRAAVFVYAPRLEPFGFAPLEAAACETPVVALAEGGVRETIRDGYQGLLVPDEDPAAMGAAIERVLEDAALARRLGRQGREDVLRTWTWDHAVDRLERELKALS
jgi:glycosyltransferase involved in cell wall biosynthesis